MINYYYLYTLLSNLIYILLLGKKIYSHSDSRNRKAYATKGGVGKISVMTHTLLGSLFGLPVLSFSHSEGDPWI